MKQKISAREKFYQLRKQAETLMTNIDFSDTPPVMHDQLKLIQELQTFQIELELQNEELHRSQQELMASNIRYTGLYDLAPVGYLTSDSKGIILNANLTLADMLLLMDRSFLLGQPMSAYIVSKDQDIYYQHIRNLADPKTRQICELRMEKTDGTSFYVQLESTILSYQIDKPEQYRTVVIDISKRKQLENEHENLQKQIFQAHKMESMATMAGGVAHNFNNILNIIVGNVELLMQDIPDWNPSYSKLKVIKSAALRAAVIVKELLHFSSMSEQEQKPMDVSEVLNDTFKLLRSMIPTTIDIITNIPDTGPMILADRVQFGQILINLCTNAAQAMEKTGGIIEVKMETQYLTEESLVHYPDLETGDYVKITVNDNGPGIDAEIMDQIFNPYFTTREFGKGSGIGLAAVHGIVKHHSGTITVDGQPGKGACFTMFFPLNGQKSEIKEERPNESIHGTENILFIEDEVSIAEVAEKTLKHFGYRVEVLPDPIDALALFKLNPGYFDVVVTNLTMPNMTGIELAEALRKIRPDIPIIISTSSSSLIDEDKTRELGISEYIEKPVSISEIAKMIRQILDKSEMERQAF